MGSTALVDQTRSTAMTLRPVDPRRTNYTTIDFGLQRYEDELVWRNYVIYANPSNRGMAGVHEQWSSLATSQAGVFAAYVNYHSDRSSYFDVLVRASQIESIGSQISDAVKYTTAAFEGIWSASGEVADQILALTAAYDSVSAGMQAWSDLYTNAIEQIAAAVTSWYPTTTVNWGRKPFDRVDDLTVLDPGIEPALSDFLERISDFARLDPDWDSYGAKSPTAEAIHAARQYLEDLVSEYSAMVGSRALPFWVSPLPNGGVQLEWRVPEAELEVEIGPEGEITYLLQTGHGFEAGFEERDEASYAEVAEILGRVLAA